MSRIDCSPGGEHLTRCTGAVLSFIFCVLLASSCKTTQQNVATNKKQEKSNMRLGPNLPIFLTTSSILLTLHQVQSQTVRRAWRDMTCDEQNDFLKAVTDLKSTDTFDEFVRVHQSNGGASHGSPEFLPWHRWFLVQYEEALRQASNNPDIFLPYWDWERDAGNEATTTVLHKDTFGSYQGTTSVDGYSCCTDGIVDYQSSPFSSTARHGECLERTFSQSVEFSNEAAVLAYITDYTQYGNNARGRQGCNGFRCAWEGTPHAAPHNWIGEHMATYFSPDDPLFYMHHANVDRIWALWQDFSGHDEISTTSYTVPDHYEGNLLNSEMPFNCPGTCSWDFTVDGSNWPTPSQMLSNDATVKVTYANDYTARQLADGFGSSWVNANWFVVASDDVPIKCDRGASPTISSNPSAMPVITPAPTASPSAVPSISPPTPSVTCQDLSSRKECNDEASCSWNKTTRSCIDATRRRGLRGLHRCEDIPFTDPSLSNRWNELCAEMPLASVSDRLKALAEDSCKSRGNPRSADDAWIAMMGMADIPSVFDCFHPAD